MFHSSQSQSSGEGALEFDIAIAGWSNQMSIWETS
uniref:Uncharacterized protein n=1 Tax=Setaria italica TaxID=4555 RepID=K3ZFR9_SETIT